MTAPTGPGPEQARALAASILRSAADSIDEIDPDLWERYYRCRPGTTDFDRQRIQAMQVLIDALQAVGHLSTGLVVHTEEAATACMDMGKTLLRSPAIRHLDHCHPDHEEAAR